MKMGGRYLVSGAQLGVLKVTQNELSRNKIIDEIIDKQFIGESSNNVGKDSQLIATLLAEEQG